MKQNRLKLVLLATALTAGAYAVSLSSAKASPTATWDPLAMTALGLVSPPFSFVPPSTVIFPLDQNITFSSISDQDFGVVAINPATGAFSESVNVNFPSFNLGGSGVPAYGLSTGTESIWLQFFGTGQRANGSVDPSPGHPIGGAFITGSFTLYIGNGKAAFGTTTMGCSTVTPGANISTGCGGTVTGVTNQRTLATGVLLAGTTTLANTAGSLTAGANVITTFVPNPAAAAAGFYVSPSSYANMDFLTSVTNTGSVLSAIAGGPAGGPNNLLVIGNNTGGGGGGSSNFEAAAVVPEPSSLVLLASGFVGIGAFGARRRTVA